MASRNEVLGTASIRCEWPGCGKLWSTWRQFANHRRIHDVSDLREPVMASLVEYRGPGAGARQIRAQVEIRGQFVHSLGFVEGVYNRDQASDDGFDMGDCNDHDDDSHDFEPGSPSVSNSLVLMGRRSLGEGGCPDDYQNNILTYKKVIERVGKSQASGFNDSESESALALSVPPVTTNESDLDFLQPQAEMTASRTVLEVTRQLVWNRVTAAESRQWFKMLKSPGFKPSELENCSTIQSSMKSAGLLKPHVQPRRANIGIGEDFLVLMSLF